MLPPELVSRRRDARRGDDAAVPVRGRRRAAAGFGARGLAALSHGRRVVLVHDAARPFADRALIDRVHRRPRADRRRGARRARARHGQARRSGAAWCAETIPRDEIWLAQTPQGFRARVLRAAIAAARPRRRRRPTRRCSPSSAGQPVAVVHGDERNVKVTTPDDLGAARARVGVGAARRHRLRPAPARRGPAARTGRRRRAVRRAVRSDIPTATSCVMRSSTPCSAPPAPATSASTFPNTDPRVEGRAGAGPARARRSRSSARARLRGRQRRRHGRARAAEARAARRDDSPRARRGVLGVSIDRGRASRARRTKASTPSGAARRSRRTPSRVLARGSGASMSRLACPVRAEPDRPPPRRQRAHGALQLAARARARRHVRPAHRGHRRRALDARVRAARFSRTCAGSGWTGTRGRTSAGRTGRTGSPSGCELYASYAQRAARRAAARTTASARRRSSKRTAQAALAAGRAAEVHRTLPRDCRRRGGAPRRRRRSAPRSGSACPRPRGDLPRPGARRRHVQHRRHRRSGASCDPTAGPPTTSPSSWTTR